MMVRNHGALTLREAASILGVCSTTVNNWVKHEYLNPIVIQGSRYFTRRDISSLKRKIDSGVIRRLSSRANKKKAGRKFIPLEYIENRKDRESVKFTLDFFREQKIDTETALFFTALNILINRDMVDKSLTASPIRFSSKKFKTVALMKEIREWYETLDNCHSQKFLPEVPDLNIPEQQDISGLVYQSLKAEGDKSFNGSYYTPKEIVDAIVKENKGEDADILDPCCGTGQFLLSFAESAGDPERLHGYDIDRTAVRIARLNIMQKYPQRDFSPNIHHTDSLCAKNLPRRYHIVATNPPWGMHFSPEKREILMKNHPEILSGESYSYFIKMGLESLREEGKLSYILPESILNVKFHRDIRKYILNNARIEKIDPLGRVFSNVFTPVIRLDLKKITPQENASFRSPVKKKSNRIDQENFRSNSDFTFTIHLDRKDRSIMEKIYSTPHTTLKGNAEWVLGIVTGNNSKYLSGRKKKGYEEIITGKDLESYRINPVEKFIRLRPDKFQQVAPVYKYRAEEKLVYKFISKKLVFAYDNKKRLTLNSANAVIPGVENYPAKVILALFNSSVYQFLFRKKFSSIKVLRSHLEELPLPFWEKSVFRAIVSMVDDIHRGKNRIPELDNYIRERFSLDEKEIQVR